MVGIVGVCSWAGIFVLNETYVKSMCFVLLTKKPWLIGRSSFNFVLLRCYSSESQIVAVKDQYFFVLRTLGKDLKNRAGDIAQGWGCSSGLGI